MKHSERSLGNPDSGLFWAKCRSVFSIEIITDYYYYYYTVWHSIYTVTSITFVEVDFFVC
jgi:hypothetical protein